jgi:carboxymethylenebutenolidase
LEITKKRITIQQDGIAIGAYLVFPKTAKKLPGIIILHEVWGLNSQIEEVAKRFAKEGYVALAPDLFSRYKDILNEQNIESAMKKIMALPAKSMSDPSAIEDAAKKMSDSEKRVVQIIFKERQKMEEELVKDIVTCCKYLTNSNAVSGKPLGAMGFCLGGGLAFQLSTIIPLGATVIFYGSNPKPLEAIEKIKGPVLCHYAETDPHINSAIPSLVENMIKYRKEFEMKIYKGTVHAFFNEQRPSYNGDAAKEAFGKTKTFFKKNLA